MNKIAYLKEFLMDANPGDFKRLLFYSELSKTSGVTSVSNNPKVYNW